MLSTRVRTVSADVGKIMSMCEGKGDSEDDGLLKVMSGNKKQRRPLKKIL